MYIYTFTLLCMSSSTSFSMPRKRDTEVKRKEIQTLKLWIIFRNSITCDSKICHTVSHFKSVSHWLKIFLERKGVITSLSSNKTFPYISLIKSLFANKKTVVESQPACLNIAIQHPSFPYCCILRHHILILCVLNFNCSSLGNTYDSITR